MSDFGGINQFGSLIVNGQKLTFEDFDKDKNGEITQEEYNELINDVKLDSVEFSSIDKDGDNAISEDELAIYDQKTQMQEIVNNMAGTISKDFSGKSEYLAELTEELKNYIEEFATNYTDDISNMAKDFKAELPEKYEELKNSVLSGDPDTVKSSVLDEIYAELISKEETRGPNGEIIKGEALPETTAKRLAKELETEANKFIKEYKGTNLEEDLKTHLEEYMNKSDAEKLEEAASVFTDRANSFGAMIDNGADLTTLKEYAKEFLLAALDKGVTLKLGGTTIKTEAAITTALKKYTDGDELKAAMEEVIAGLNTATLKESIIAEEKQKAIDDAEKAFVSIKGSEYQVNASLIDYSGIPGYFENTQIHERGKGWGGSKDKAFAKGQEILNNESLKNQMKTQIQNMLAEKGISFDKIANIFENVYNQSITDTLNAEGMITGRGARGLSSKGHAYLNTKDCVDAFINTFNTNIAKAIDEMNASNQDFDTIDLDYAAAGKDENGNPIIDEATGTDASTLYATGKILTTKKRGADYYLNLAETMIDNMKSQMLKKAKAMCDANGVEFDNTVFTTMFNNAKSIAINAGVSGIDSKGASISFGSTALGAGIGAGAVGAAGATVGAIAGGTVGAAAFMAGTTLGSALGPIGTAVGAVVGGLISLFGSGNHSSSTLDTKKLLDTFTENFKVNYTAWVDAEKAKQNNI